MIGTSLLARQLGWVSGQEMLAPSTAEAFAEACARLYTDPALSYALRRQGLARLVEEERQHDFAAVLERVVGAGIVTIGEDGSIALPPPPAHDHAQGMDRGRG